MTRRSIGSKAIVWAGLLGFLLGSLSASARGPEEKGKPDALRKELARRDFIVQDGQVAFPKILEKCCNCEFPSCFANNASSRYGLWALPPAPNQDPSVANPYTEWFTADGTFPPGFCSQWRLRPDEAVLFLGKTPQKMTYFGFTSYIYDRYLSSLGYIPPCIYPDGTTRVQPDSARYRFPMFASLGDTVNPMTIHLAGGRQDPFEKNAIFLLTADKGTERKVRKALVEAGYPEESINLLPLSSEIARLGLGSQDDSIEVVIRLTGLPGQDVSPYYDVPKTLLRISPATPVPPEKLDPVAPPKLRTRGTGKSEASLMAAVDALGQAIVASYPTYTATPVTMEPFVEGYNCITNMQNCLGDNRDTVFIPPAFDPIHQTLLQEGMTLGADEFYVAYGVNHTEAKKATYSNISVMGWQHKAAPIMVGNDEMVGSARYYLGSSADPTTEQKLYAFRIAREDGCAGAPFCKELPTDCVNGIAADEPVALVFRAYLEPATKVGPAYAEVILDRILKFTPNR